MAEGVDYSFSVPSAAGLAAAGKTFAGRYVGPGSGKFLTPAERDALFAHGIDVFLLAEGNADSAAGGYTVGVQHAQMANNHARQLGAPDSTVIYFAVDYDVQPKEWVGPREYLRGACDVLGRDRVGVYGSYNVMAWAQRDAVAAWFFQTYAWSAGQWFTGNHVEQYLNGVNLAGGDVDLCRSMVSYFGQWPANGRDAAEIFPGFHQRGDDMPKFFRVDQGGLIGVTNGPTWYHLSSDDAVDAALRIWGQTRADILAINEHDLVACGQQVLPPFAAGGPVGPPVLVPHTHTAGVTGPAQPE